MFSTFFLGSCSRADNEVDISKVDLSTLSKANLPDNVAKAPFGESCFEGAACDDPIPETIVIHGIPDYPDCTFEVTVDYCKIVSGVQTNYIVSDYNWVDFVALSEANGCEDFWDDWVYAAVGRNGVWHEYQLIDFVTSIDNQIYLGIENYFLNREGEEYDCTTGGAVTVELITSSCTSICTYELKIEGTDDGPDGGLSGSGVARGEKSAGYRGSRPIYTYVKQTCNETACCMRKTEQCYNSETNEYERTSIIYPIGDFDCNDDTEIETPPPYTDAELISCTPCNVSCN